MMHSLVVLVTVLTFLTGCGDRGGGTGEKSKAEKAVEEVVTKEFKLYDKAKESIQKAQEESQERREAEKQVR
ncbi:MAG: hypothetical protein HYT78_18420 [Deltaproteobacteria bacterium]|nr:hypothetical protein [Deltaproteobacteria bacterium]